MPLLLPIHIAAAALGLLSGAVALSVAKGGMIHRKSGMVFAYAMIAMCASATVAAVVRGQAVNVMAALMTAYLVLTGLMTVRPPSAVSRRRDVGLMLMALALGVATIAAGFVAIASPNGEIFGYPPFPFFLFGVLGLSGGAGLGAVLAIALAAAGAWTIPLAAWAGALVSVASFFSIARVARYRRRSPARPRARAAVLLVLVAMFYWLQLAHPLTCDSGATEPPGRITYVLDASTDRRGGRRRHIFERVVGEAPHIGPVAPHHTDLAVGLWIHGMQRHLVLEAGLPAGECEPLSVRRPRGMRVVARIRRETP